MKRIRCSIAAGLTAAAMAGATAGAAPASPRVDGAMVNPDVPATYRLPAVASAASPPASHASPLFFPPSHRQEPRLAARSSFPSISTASPAGPPPDDRSAPPAGELSSQLLPAVQRGTGLAHRGALFAARTEFVQVLRRLAQAKDAAANSREHSQALAAGLRALDEAEDFAPSGVQLEAEMNVPAIASAHRTAVLPHEAVDVTPFDAIELYHAFATQQLARAAIGERAGSMALYGLGRINARLAESAGHDLHHSRTAMTMYAAALDASPDNHLAANELGVLLCRAGRPQQAIRLFQRAIDAAPSSTSYHNLAMAQQKVGLVGQAAANEQESQRLAAWERSQGDLSRRAGVDWVSPDELAQAAQPGPQMTATAAPQRNVQSQASRQPRWR